VGCRTVRAISSDRGKVVSGSDDQSVIVWDKQTSQLLEELKGHDAQVCLLRPSMQVFYIRNRTRKVLQSCMHC
jgi:WD40 repeat protein